MIQIRLGITGNPTIGSAGRVTEPGREGRGYRGEGGHGQNFGRGYTDHRAHGGRGRGRGRGYRGGRGGRGSSGRSTSYDDGLFIPDEVLNSLNSTQRAMIFTGRDKMRKRTNESGGQRSAKRVQVEIPEGGTADTDVNGPNYQTEVSDITTDI
jgi:hypothetical protein